MTLPEGAILENRYQIERLLAQGGMGAVYKGFDTKLKAAVAVKENVFQSPQSGQQFEQEALILAGLRHSSLPRVTDHFRSEGQQYLVMDYIEGEDLWEIVKQRGRPLSEVQALNYIIQICDAVSYLHQRNPPIIHRDIKPKNIKITPNGEAILVDFGIAKISHDQTPTQSGARGLTPGFSPPEQYSKIGTTPASDIYALGATLYAVLTAQEPPDSISLLVNQAAYKPPTQINAAISKEVSDAITHAMQAKVSDRPKSVPVWRDELIASVPRQTALLGDENAFSRPPAPIVLNQENDVPGPSIPVVVAAKAEPAAPKPLPPVAQLPARRQRFPWVVLLIILLVFGVGGAAWWANANGFLPTISPGVGSVKQTATILEAAQAVVVEAEKDATLQAVAEADAAATQQADANVTLTTQALDRIRLEIEQTAQAQAAIVATAAAISTSAIEAEQTATSDTIATAAADVELTVNAIGTVSAGIDATATSQTQATETAQVSPTPTPTSTPTITATDQATATPTIASPVLPTTTPFPTATPTPEITGKLAFSLPQGTDYKVYVIEMQATAPAKPFADISSARNPALSPDGKYILIDGTGSGLNAIIRRTSTGFEVMEVTCRSITSDSGRPSWSPDGIFLVFDGLGADPANPQAYIHAVDRPQCDLEPFRFTIGGGGAIENNGLHPIWGPDYRIYFRSCATWIVKKSDCGIWSADPNGNDLLKLHDNPNQLQTDVDREQVLMMSAETGNWEIYTLNLADSQVANLTNNPSADVWGTLSPDGRTIAYLSNRNGRWAIWLVDADGGAPREWLPLNPDWGEVDPDQFALERMSWSP